MKKVLSFLTIFVCLFSLHTSKAKAAGIITYGGSLFVVGKGTVFVFNASNFRNKDVRNATIFVGSNFHKLGCTANKDDERIVCVIRGGISDEYGGETGVIYLGRQVFYVTIPFRIPRIDPEDEEEDGESSCGGSEVLGADVEFEDIAGSLSTEFVPGETLDEVDTEARAQVDSSMGDLVRYRVVGELGCDVPPPDQI